MRDDGIVAFRVVCTGMVTREMRTTSVPQRSSAFLSVPQSFKDNGRSRMADIPRSTVNGLAGKCMKTNLIFRPAFIGVLRRMEHAVPSTAQFSLAVMRVFLQLNSSGDTT